MNSWDKSDSYYCNREECPPDTETCRDLQMHYQCIGEYDNHFVIGDSDMKLAQSLIRAGTDHSKFMRQIMVSVDITAPLYWWKEFDTYKVGTVANSTSTMHKLASTKITPDCFEFDATPQTVQNAMCDMLEATRKCYNESKCPVHWRALVQLLPSAWLQTRTVTMSYQNIRAMYFARQNHKLSEWSEDLLEWVEGLPYADELIMIGG